MSNFIKRRIRRCSAMQPSDGQRHVIERGVGYIILECRLFESCTGTCVQCLDDLGVVPFNTSLCYLHRDKSCNGIDECNRAVGMLERAECGSVCVERVLSPFNRVTV